MANTTITNLEKKIQQNSLLDKADQKELLDLLSMLKTEINDLSQTNRECAESIAGFTQASTHEATRKDRNKQLIDISLKGLSSSVESLEASHPKVVDIVNRISQLLSNMGI